MYALILTSLLLAVVPARPGPVALSPPRVTDVAEEPTGLGKAVDAYLERAAAYGFSGAVLIARGDDVILREGYGLADRVTARPVTPTTVFSVGSITKQFTAAAVLELESEGKLSVEDPVSEYLPYIPPDKSTITISQLLAHTSGLDDDYPDQYPDLTPQEYREHVLTTSELRFAPGTGFAYSNFGYYLLGHLVEVVSGMGWEEYLRRAFFEPLGMRRTGYRLPDWPVDSLAHYDDLRSNGEWGAVPRDEIVVPVRRPPYLWADGSGGLLSTVDDMLRWHRALSSGEALSPDAVERLYTVQRRGYGFGWEVGESPLGGRRVWHGGYDTSLGVLAFFERHLDADLTIVLLSNSNVNRELTSEVIGGTLRSLMFGGEIALPPAASSPAARAGWPAGTWRLPGGETVTVEVQGPTATLHARSPEAVLATAFPESGAAGTDVDPRVASVVEGLLSDDAGPLTTILWEQADAETVSRQMMAFAHGLVARLGPLEEIRPLVDSWYDPAKEVWKFVLLRFENGFQVLRILENARGELLFRDVRLDEAVEKRLASQGGGLFSFWDFRLGRVAWLRYDATADRLVLTRDGAAIVLTRVEGEGG